MAVAAIMLGAAPGLTPQPADGAANRPAPGSWSLSHKGGHRGAFSISFSVAPNRRKINFAFFQAKLRCIGPGSTIESSNEWYGFVSDAYTKRAAVLVRHGRFSLSDKVRTAKGTQYVDIQGHFTGRRSARGKVSMDMTMNDGRDCLIGSFSGDVYKVWKAKRIADPRIKVEPPAVKPGAKILVTGRGLLKRRPVTLYVPGTKSPRVYHFRVNHRGRFARRVRIGKPPDGTFRVAACQLIVPDFTHSGYYFWDFWSARVRGADNFVITRKGAIG